MAPGNTRDAARARLLAIDDEVMNLELLQRSLRKHYDVLTAPSPERALEIMRDEPDIAIILSDYRMPGMSGAELLAESMKTHADAKRVIITGYAEADNVISAINSGQIHYLIKKPWKHRELLQILEQLVHSYELEGENRRLVGDLRKINDELRTKEKLLVRNLDDKGRDLVSASHELDRMNRELEVLSFKDTLTSLYNHRAFQERLREELARAQRYGQPLALLYGDIDFFSQINKELGYQIGDEILRRVAAVMSSKTTNTGVRESDIVARYSGEEFVLLLPETGKQGAQTKARRLRESIAEAQFPGARPITMSFGVAAYPEDAATCEELIHCAERALHAAKVSGRNRVQTFTSNIDEGAIAENIAVPIADASVSLIEQDRFHTYHDQLHEVISLLRRDRAITCLYVDLSALRRIELELGAAQHAELYDSAGALLDGMRGEQLRSNDLICRTDYDDAYLCFLSPSRGREEAQSFDLEKIASRVQEALNTALSASVRDLIRDKPRIVVGHARVLNNSMLRPERLVTRLISEAQGSATLARERSAQRNKTLLQEIILGDGLTPVYQPIVHIRTGDIFGYEALTRGPRHSPLESPATLFAVAEEVDLVFELDRACFRGALRGAVGLEPIHRLFVNLLPLSFYDTSFIEQEVSVLLEAAALTPANIVFEITERLAIENFTTFRRALGNYTAMGFGVAIDDVGTRHSNLETVMALRPHFIKISDVLIRGVARSSVKREMLRSLGNIAATIDAVIVAEGIETADDLVVLHDLGVTYAQGFFLARPGPPFPRLRASVRRAVHSIAQQPRTPTPAPPADFDFENDGYVREDTNPSVRHAAQMAIGSGQFLVDDSKLTEPLEETQEVGRLADDDDDTSPGIHPGRRRKRPITGQIDDPADAFDDFHEKTRPRPAPEQTRSASLVEELGIADSEAAAPLLDSLRRTSTETDLEEPPGGDNGVN